MKAWLKHAQPLVLALAAAAVFAACDEQLDAGLACPALCPQLETTVRDTTIFAVELDTAIAGFPAFGTELELFIASLGDTLETRGVIRYDSLPGTFRHANTAEDSAIYAVDTGSVIKLRLAANDTLGGPVTIEAYDVDLNGPDDDDPTLAATAFTADRLLGSHTFAAESLKDSISVPIDPNILLGKIQTAAPGNRLRIGLRVTQSGQARLSMFASNGGGAPLLVFRPSTDTTVAVVRWGPRSMFPTQEIVRSDLADYLLIIKSPPAPPPGVVRVGGMPGQRAYFRFNIPSSILDSSSVVRATLFLTQRPNPFSPEPNDSVLLQQFAVTAGPSITDLARALLFLTSSTTDSVIMAAADSGVRSFEMIGLVREWRATSVDRTPRAWALRAATEGHLARQIDFFSNEASVNVRPRLRLTYVPRLPDRLP